MPGGRPMKFETVKELQEKINAYFADCDPHWEEQGEWVDARDENRKVIYNDDGQAQQKWVVKMVQTKQKPYTITGLALALDTTRETLLDYENNPDREEFSDTIKRAKIKCQNFAESSLFASNATGPIFNLKNNYNWRDQSEVKHSGQINRNATEEELDAIIERANRSQASTDTET